MTSAALVSGVATHVGLVRAVNQDGAVAAGGVYAVADGMGGHAAGEVASAITVRRLGLLAGRGEVTADAVRAELAAANAEVLADVAANPERTGMGTTACGVVAVTAAGSPHWAVFNVGDSRVYRLVDGELTQLTVDHSEAVDEGDGRGRRQLITRAIGTDPAPEADVWVFPPTAGERFLICSDGLSLEVSDVDIAGVLRVTADPQRAAEVLVERAVASGGRDNVTAVVLDHAVPADPGCGDTAPRAR